MTVDTKRLRNLAQNATPGPWTRTRDNGVHAGKPKRCIGSMYDSEYVAAADPQTVLGLLEQLEAKEQECEVLHREYANLEAEHARLNGNWDELCVEIAKAVGTKEDRECAEMGEMDEFDPWHAIRLAGSQLSACRSALAEACNIGDALANYIANNNPYADKLGRVKRIAELRKAGGS